MNMNLNMNMNMNMNMKNEHEYEHENEHEYEYEHEYCLSIVMAWTRNVTDPNTGGFQSINCCTLYVVISIRQNIV